MQDLTFIDAFSGINGFDLGFGNAQIKTGAHIEINKHCQQVLRAHDPDTPILGDISDVTGSALRDLCRAQIMAGGFPCQDTSIGAPHRLGLAGKRSGHFYSFTRLVEEYQRARRRRSIPDGLVIENPTGLLKSNGGRDMATVVRGLENLGYGWAYRVVDGRYLGTPQRRPESSWSDIVEETPDPHGPFWVTPAPGGEADRPRRVSGPSLGPAPAGALRTGLSSGASPPEPVQP